MMSIKEGTHTRKKSQRSSSASMKLAVSMNHMRKVCRRSWYSWNPGQVMSACGANTTRTNVRYGLSLALQL